MNAIERFCEAASRPAIAVHQRDPGLAAAVKAAGMPELLDADGLVHHGKGEAMLVGMALAALAGRRYVGYVDADNYVPGAVHEYCRAYAAGLHLADSPHAMVRISWHSKPKLQNGRLFFSRWGRTSQVTNHFLNRLISEYSGFGTEIVATGNAGEHALTLDLGMRMRFAGGFAVEPYEFIDLFEQFGGVFASPHPDVMSGTVQILQIETRNPHFHDNKGDEHVQDMRVQSLHALYHSPIALPAVREEILALLREQGALADGAEPPEERVYPPVDSLDLERLHAVLSTEARTYREIERRRPTGITVEPPIARPVADRFQGPLR